MSGDRRLCRARSAAALVNERSSEARVALWLSGADAAGGAVEIGIERSLRRGATAAVARLRLPGADGWSPASQARFLCDPHCLQLTTHVADGHVWAACLVGRVPRACCGIFTPPHFHPHPIAALSNYST